VVQRPLCTMANNLNAVKKPVMTIYGAEQRGATFREMTSGWLSVQFPIHDRRIDEGRLAGPR